MTRKTDKPHKIKEYEGLEVGSSPSAPVFSCENREVINISVRNLVEFLLRSGDIDEGTAGAGSVSAMQKGAVLHRRIQKKMGADYHSEVPLSFSVSYEEYDLRISGRADGIIYDPSEEVITAATIDEIKGVFLDVKGLEEPDPIHLAQAKCYACIFASENCLSEIQVTMTYGNLHEMDIRRLKRFDYSYTIEELSEWFMSLLSQYKRWSDYLISHRRDRDASIKSLEFPFLYRRGQKKLMQDVYRSIYAEKLLFLQAPTGTGKTIATVFPAVKAMGEQLCQRIFYVTAKTAAKSVAKDTFAILDNAGLQSGTVELTARDKICPLDERKCNPRECEYACGHFDRINDAVFDIINSCRLIYRDDILQWSEKFKVCPFEYSLDIAMWCDNIIGDYNYIFDPHVYLKRFFGEGKSEESIFLIDEAHNLVERGRDMYSEALVKEEFLAARRLVKNYSKSLASSLNKCNRLMLSLKKISDTLRVVDLSELEGFVFALMKLVAEMDKFFERRIEYDGSETVRELYFKVRSFLEIFDEVDDKSFKVYSAFDDEGDFFVKLLCINPSSLLQKRLDRARTAVFFSATLLPVSYYISLLCDTKDYYAIYSESSFEEKNRRILIGSDVTSIYKRRGPDEYRRFADYIYNVISQRNGNYIVFAPSYAFMDSVLDAFLKLDVSGIDIEVQNRSMGEEDRETFLAGFCEDNQRTLVGFAVVGGSFSEGIDLKGEKLIGTIILGCPLPMVTGERALIQEFFGIDGFDYAYLYPGMNKVLQAAGRVIRTADDKGVIVLLDERYNRPAYRRCFPREWSEVENIRCNDIGNKIVEFWETVD